MRLTCLKCGQQYELDSDPDSGPGNCICGAPLEPMRNILFAVEPDRRAAKRSREKAFRAAGISRNVGAYALGISLLGLLFFPLGLVGAGIGVYCLLLIKGPLAAYSGRRSAAAGVVLGIAIFVAEGMALMSLLESHETNRLVALQLGVAHDLKSLRRAEVLYHASRDGYGGFDDFSFEPTVRGHTIFLGKQDLLPAKRNGVLITDPLPLGIVPGVGAENFTAVAVANLDDDPALDVWLMTATGEPLHLADDLKETEVRDLRLRSPLDVGGADPPIKGDKLDAPTEQP